MPEKKKVVRCRTNKNRVKDSFKKEENIMATTFIIVGIIALPFFQIVLPLAMGVTQLIGKAFGRTIFK